MKTAVFTILLILAGMIHFIVKAPSDTAINKLFSPYEEDILIQAQVNQADISMIEYLVEAVTYNHIDNIAALPITQY